MKLAFLGLGVMGYPMAGHLVRAGHEVTVYNRTVAKAVAWRNEYGSVGRVAHAESPAEAALDAAVVFMCVGNDNDVREVSIGARGAISAMAQGAVLVDHTTASAGLARELEEHAKAKGLGFLDAPVSGGQAGAIGGRLTVMCGGEELSFRVAEPVMRHYGHAVTLMGPAGSGQLTKMVNQILIAGLVQGLAEGLNFATRAGLDAGAVVDVLSKGAGQSWQLEHRAQTMTDGKFEFGFAVDWMRKDLESVSPKPAATDPRFPSRLSSIEFYQRVQDRGGGRWDTSSLIDLLARP